MKNLQYLSINRIHADIGHLPQLKALALGEVKGEFPESFQQLQSLEALSLPGTNLGTIPDFVVQLSNLRVLILSGWGNLNAFPSNFEQLQKLKYLYIAAGDKFSQVKLPKALEEQLTLYVPYH